MPTTIDLPGAPMLPLPPPPLDPHHQPPRGWRKFFAVAGIVGGFLILFTIPGWAAVGTYRRWKAGQRGQPNLLIAWGVCFVLLCSGFVVLEVAARVAPAGTAKALSGVVPDPEVSMPPGMPEVTSAPGEDGWTKYEVREGGFSFELPEGWQPGVNGTDGEPVPPEALFVATLFDANGGVGFAVTRVHGVDVTEEPLETGERLAQLIQRDDGTLGKVEVSGAYLPMGSSYLVEWEAEAPEDLYDTGFMVYGASHYGFAYQFIFAFPLVDGGDYRTQADYIARSITWTTWTT